MSIRLDHPRPWLMALFAVLMIFGGTADASRIQPEGIAAGTYKLKPGQTTVPAFCLDQSALTPEAKHNFRFGDGATLHLPQGGPVKPIPLQTALDEGWLAVSGTGDPEQLTFTVNNGQSYDLVVPELATLTVDAGDRRELNDMLRDAALKRELVRHGGANAMTAQMRYWGTMRSAYWHRALDRAVVIPFRWEKKIIFEIDGVAYEVNAQPGKALEPAQLDALADHFRGRMVVFRCEVGPNGPKLGPDVLTQLVPKYLARLENALDARIKMSWKMDLSGRGTEGLDAWKETGRVASYTYMPPQQPGEIDNQLKAVLDRLREEYAAIPIAISVAEAAGGNLTRLAEEIRTQQTIDGKPVADGNHVLLTCNARPEDVAMLISLLYEHGARSVTATTSLMRVRMIGPLLETLSRENKSRRRLADVEDPDRRMLMSVLMGLDPFDNLNPRGALINAFQHVQNVMEEAGELDDAEERRLFLEEQFPISHEMLQHKNAEEQSRDIVPAELFFLGHLPCPAGMRRAA